MGYTRNDILSECKRAFNDIKTFYKQPFINYNGRTSDTNEYYTEVVADFLCSNITSFVNGVPKITREKTYNTNGHTGDFNTNTSREEEKIAMEMFKQSKNGSDYDFVGRIIDYQTPLKNERTDVAGKIDLLSYNGEVARILELKKPDSDESMLRCVLEGFTYLQTVNKEKLLEDFCLPKTTVLKASPFVFRDGIQRKQMNGEHPNLLKLMRLLDSKPYYIIKENNLYEVEE